MLAKCLVTVRKASIALENGLTVFTSAPEEEIAEDASQQRRLTPKLLKVCLLQCLCWKY